MEIKSIGGIINCAEHFVYKETGFLKVYPISVNKHLFNISMLYNELHDDI